MNDLNCPYCDEDLEVDHDDGAGYEEDILHQQECNKCGKTFTFETSISYYYEAYKADCLNDDGEHEYELSHTYPKCFSTMRCKTCSEERELTEKERKEFQIETKEDYFERLKN